MEGIWPAMINKEREQILSDTLHAVFIVASDI